MKNISFKTLASKRMKQRGLSILGALFALVIGALLTIPLVNGFLDSQRKTRIEATLQDLRTMVADVQKTYGANNQYGALTTAVAVQSNIVPQRLRDAGANTATNTYNGAITFAPDTITLANDSALITFANVPREDCADIVVGMEQLARRVDVAAVAVKPNDGALAVATLATQCDSAARVAIAFSIGRKG